MDIRGTYLLPCPRERAWDALNDPDLLKPCLKGCEQLERTSDHSFAGIVATRIGPVSARFSGTMTQSEIDPPASCLMSFEGQGGVAGFARGTARVTLDEAEGGTRLTYAADTKMGGKLAQLGARLIEGVARSMADDFFARFAAAVEEAPAAVEAIAPGPDPEPVADSAPRGRSPTLVIIAVAAVLLALAALLLRH